MRLVVTVWQEPPSLALMVPLTRGVRAASVAVLLLRIEQIGPDKLKGLAQVPNKLLVTAHDMLYGPSPFYRVFFALTSLRNSKMQRIG